MRLSDRTQALLMWGALFLIAALCAFAVVRDTRSWREFVETHNCLVVARERGEIMTVTTYTPETGVGFGTASTPSKTSWLCDDGITYIR